VTRQSSRSGRANRNRYAPPSPEPAWLSRPKSPTFTQSKASTSSARVFFGSYTTSTLSTGREPGSRLPNRPHAGTNCSPKDSKRNAGSGDVPAFVLVLLTRSVT
jgi:hypothetical protein